MANENYHVDEKIWAEYNYWPYHEAEWLLLDIDPEHLENNYSVAVTEEQERLKSRARRVMDKLRQRTEYRASMPPLELIEHLERHDLRFPERLVAAVNEVASRNVDPISEKAERSSDLKRSRNKLLSMYLAAAIDKYSWSPGNDKQAILQIVDGARRRGLAVDDQTVRTRLAEAIISLPDKARHDVATALNVRPNQLIDWAMKRLPNSPAK